MSYPIIKGQTFATGDQVTASKLNNLVDQATFDSDVVDGSTLQVSGDQLSVKDGGITAAKLESGTNGQLFIGNGSGFTKATLTAGQGIAVTNASGSITIATTEPLTEVAYASANVAGTGSYVDSGLSVTLSAGTYLVETTLILGIQTATTATYDIRLTGTATTTAIYGSSVTSYDGGYAADNHEETTLPLTISSIDKTTDPVVAKIGLVVTVSVSGTLKWQFSSASTDGLRKGSYMKVIAL